MSKMLKNFKVGDFVKVNKTDSGGVWSGFYGIIIAVGVTGDEGIKVLLTGFSGGSRWFKKRNLELVARA